MTDIEWDHLGLKGWPFNRASRAAAEIWIGRPEVKKRLRVHLRSASRVPASQLLLLWADLGAGKTHTLHHMQTMVEHDPSIVTIFVTTPEGITSFFDVYRACIDGAIAAGALEAAGRDLFERTGGNVETDVERAIIRIGTYREDVKRIAYAWLRGEPVQRAAVRDLDVTSRIKSSAEAIDALNDLIRILKRGDRTVILLVDETQEFADLSDAKRAEAVGGLHKVFDRNPEGLTLVLSFTAAAQDTMTDIIGGPLTDRVNDTMELSAITTSDAEDLIVGLMTHWAIDPAAAPQPFTRDAITSVITALEQHLPALTPRDVITAFDGILRCADLDIDDGSLAIIDEAYALQHLNLPNAGAND